MDATHGYSATKDAHLKRLRRIEGQVRGIQRMVEEDTYCIDEHMAHCVVTAARAGGVEQETKLREASEAIARLVRS
jgi:DNA-binding FrmR family transcriptional regulator